MALTRTKTSLITGPINGLTIGQTTPAAGTFTTLTTNGNTGIGGIPTSTLDVISAASSPIISLSAYGSWRYQILQDRATKTFRIRDQSAGDLDRFIIDPSGNVGIGVTPSAWGATYKPLQLGYGASIFGRSNSYSQVGISSGEYHNGTNSVYLSNTAAAQYQQDSGIHYWFTAPSGTAGNPITWTQAMTLAYTGWLSVPTGATIGGGSMHKITSGGQYNSITQNNDVLLRGEGVGVPIVLACHDGSGIRVNASTIQFRASGALADQMTLDSSGTLWVGSLNSLINGGMLFSHNSGSDYRQVGHATGTASGSQFDGYYYNGGLIGSITQNGTTSVAYNTTSDHRLKLNVRPADANRFNEIEFVDFEWVDGRHDCGVIAHKLQAIYPDLVIGEKDATEIRKVEITPEVKDDDGNVTQEAVFEDQEFPVYQQVNYIGLIGRMGTRIQKLDSLVQTLIESNQALNAKIEALESKVQ